MIARFINNHGFIQLSVAPYLPKDIFEEVVFYLNGIFEYISEASERSGIWNNFIN